MFTLIGTWPLMTADVAVAAVSDYDDDDDYDERENDDNGDDDEDGEYVLTVANSILINKFPKTYIFRN